MVIWCSSLKMLGVSLEEKQDLSLELKKKIKLKNKGKKLSVIFGKAEFNFSPLLEFNSLMVS